MPKPPEEEKGRKKKEERVRFPFGESMDGSFDKYLRSKQLDPEASDALGPAFESETGRTPLPLLRPQSDSDVAAAFEDDSGEDRPSETGLVLDESDEGEIASPLARQKPPAPPPRAPRPAPVPIELDDDDSSLEVRSPLAKARPASPAPPPRLAGGESSDIRSPLPAKKPPTPVKASWDPGESVDGPVFESDSQDGELGSDEGILADGDSDEQEVDYPGSGEELQVPAPGRPPAPPPLAPRPPAPPTPGPMMRPAPPSPPPPRPAPAPAPPQRPAVQPAAVAQPAAAQPAPPKGPAASSVTPGEQTLPPFYPREGAAPPVAPRAPAAPSAGGKKATLPPSYPAPPAAPTRPDPATQKTLQPGAPPPADPFGSAGGRGMTLPPSYPAKAADLAAQKTLQPGAPPPADPFGSAGGRGQTLPPVYPARPGDPGAQKTLQPGYRPPPGEETMAPTYPAPPPPTDPRGLARTQQPLAPPPGGAQRTLPPNYPAPPPAGPTRTLPPNYPAPPAVAARGPDPFASSRGGPPAPPPAFDPRRTAPLSGDEGSSESVPAGHAFRNMIDGPAASSRRPIPRTDDEFDPVAAPLEKGRKGPGASYAVSLSDDGAINVESDVGPVEPAELAKATAPTKPVPRPNPKPAFDLMRTQPVDLDAFDEVIKSDSDVGGLAEAGVPPPPLRPAGITSTPSRPVQSKASKVSKAGKVSKVSKVGKASKVSRLDKKLTGLRALHAGSGEWLVEDSAEGNALALLQNLKNLSDAGVIHPSDEGEVLQLGISSDVNAFRRTMELPALPSDPNHPLWGSDDTITPVVLPPPPTGKAKKPPKPSKPSRDLLDFESLDDAVASAETVPAMRAMPRPQAGILAPAIPLDPGSGSGIGPVAGESALDELGKSVIPESAEVEAPEILESGEVDVQDEIETADEESALEAGLPSSAELPAPKLEAFFTRAIQLWESDALWILMGLGGATLGPIFMFLAWGYYSLPTVQRFSHPWHDQLKPGGEYGLVFGIAASALFLANLSYVLRRRFGLFKRLISLRLWLNVHFVCGLVGASLVLAHSALLGNNSVALVCSAAIAVAVASGIFGRYVLFHLPRYHEEGEEDDQTSLEREIDERKLSAARLAELARQIRAGLAEHPRMRDAALEALAAHANPPPARGLLFAPLLLVSDFRAMVRNRRLASELKNLLRTTKDKQARAIIQDTLRLIRNQSRLERRLSEAEAVRDLMDTWRGIHFIVALIAVVTMGLHVFLARFAV